MFLLFLALTALSVDDYNEDSVERRLSEVSLAGQLHRDQSNSLYDGRTYGYCLVVRTTEFGTTTEEWYKLLFVHPKQEEYAHELTKTSIKSVKERAGIEKPTQKRPPPREATIKGVIAENNGAKYLVVKTMVAKPLNVPETTEK